MEVCSVTLWMISLVLEVGLILGAKRGGLLGHFPFFYSYMAYVFAGSAFTFLIYLLEPLYYATAHWFYFLLCLLAQFAVLMEISRHIFQFYPAIRQLGQLITVGIIVAFFLLYILPALLQPRASSVALLDLSMRVSLTQGVIVASLAVAAQYYGVPLGRNVAGLMLGFALFVGVDVVNYAVAERFGRALYANVLRFMSPLAYTVCLLVWTMAMRRFEPVLLTSPKPGEHAEETSEALSYRLERFNTALTKLLRK